MKLSEYAFSEYGHDAKLYNGISDLEASNAALLDALEESIELLETMLREFRPEAINRMLNPWRAMVAKARGEST